MKRRKVDPRDWVLVILIIPLGILFMMIAGQFALRLAVLAIVNADMRSVIDPSENFLGIVPGEIEPLAADILTLPAWADRILTPQSPFQVTVVPVGGFDRTAIPTFGLSTPTSGLPATPTQTPYPTITPWPTSTLVYLPTATQTPVIPTATHTFTPIPPTPTPLPNVNVYVSKADSGSTYNRGDTLTYTVIVGNNGAHAANGVMLRDAFNTNFSDWTWICTPFNGATGCSGTTSSADFSNTLNLPVGSRIEYLVTAKVKSDASGDITNTASVTIPAIYTDTNPADNSASDTNIPYIDVQVTKNSAVTTYTLGGTVTYTITVTNVSTFDLNSVLVTDHIPGLVTSWAWACTSQTGGANGCDAVAANNSNFTDSINLPANGSRIVYTITATIHPNAAGSLVNTVNVSVPSGFVDVVPANNTATEVDANPSGELDVGPPDGNVFVIGWRNTSPSFYLSQPIVANGDLAADFVFYEFPYTPGILLDHIIIEISADGSTWYQIFYWGDDIADTNSNVDIVNLIGDLCPLETDNCPIPAARLHNNTGIRIDIDNSPLSVVPFGNYHWIRFAEPGIVPDPSDGAHVDSIEILP